MLIMSQVYVFSFGGARLGQVDSGKRRFERWVECIVKDQEQREMEAEKPEEERRKLSEENLKVSKSWPRRSHHYRNSLKMQLHKLSFLSLMVVC